MLAVLNVTPSTDQKPDQLSDHEAAAGLEPPTGTATERLVRRQATMLSELRAIVLFGVCVVPTCDHREGLELHTERERLGHVRELLAGFDDRLSDEEHAARKLAMAGCEEETAE